jgi:magnesium chelatase family protein
MDVRALQRHARLDARGEEIMRAARERGMLSARGQHRVLGVARTIADLNGSARIRARDLGGALAMNPEAAHRESRTP